MAKIEWMIALLAFYFNYDGVVLEVKRQLKASKSTVCFTQIVDFVSNKSSISTRKIVNFDA